LNQIEWDVIYNSFVMCRVHAGSGASRHEASGNRGGQGEGDAPMLSTGSATGCRWRSHRTMARLRCQWSQEGMVHAG